MVYFPINLDMRNKAAVVIGGGTVALRKCLSLLDAGALVTVIAPRIDPSLRELAEAGKIVCSFREYQLGDLDGAMLVIAATSDRQVNRSVADNARDKGILANIADEPEAGTFTIPASFCRGDLLITISTAGKSPALARTIRHQLEDIFGPEYASTIDLLGKLREKLLTDTGNREYNNKIFNDLVAQDLPGLFRKSAFCEINELLFRLLGPAYTLAELGIKERDPS